MVFDKLVPSDRTVKCPEVSVNNRVEESLGHTSEPTQAYADRNRDSRLANPEVRVNRLGHTCKLNGICLQG